MLGGIDEVKRALLNVGLPVIAETVPFSARGLSNLIETSLRLEKNIQIPTV